MMIGQKSSTSDFLFLTNATVTFVVTDTKARFAVRKPCHEILFTHFWWFEIYCLEVFTQ